MVQKALLDVVQAILEQADSLPAMSQSLIERMFSCIKIPTR